MKIRRYNGSSWVQEYPEVNVSAIVTSGTPSSSTFLRGDGAWAVPPGDTNADTVDSLHASSFIRSDANDDFSGTLNYTPDTGTILSVDGQAVIQRMTANGALTIGHDDAVIIAGGDTSGVLNSNINNATETVFVGAEGGFVAYAFPNNSVTWSNRKEMNWNGTNLTLLGNNVATQSWVNSQGFITTDTTLSTEQVQDIVGAMVSSNTESNMSVTYDDTNGKLNFSNSAPDQTVSLTGSGATSVSGTYPNFTISSTDTNTNTQLSNEQVQDIVGAMLSGNSESGITVVYEDGDGTIDFNVNDPTITLTGAVTGSATMTNLGNVSIATTATSDPTLTLSGDASGSATFTNLGNATLSVTVANDSHTHDGRYYTETETNNLLASKLATTAAAAAVTYVTSCPTANNTTGMKVYVGSTDCSTKYSGWLYLVT